MALQSQLEGTENRITVARKDYIDAVQRYKHHAAHRAEPLGRGDLLSRRQAARDLHLGARLAKRAVGAFLSMGRFARVFARRAGRARVPPARPRKRSTTPALTGRVVDEARVLSAGTHDKLEGGAQGA